MFERRLHRDCGALFSLPALLPDEVHVWIVRLDLASGGDYLISGCLSDDEIQRAGRFLLEPVRRRFAVCRATLRVILGSYLDVPPRALGFRYEAHGKPRLDGNRGELLRFNVSHSEELALVAVSEEREIGVDVERVRPLDDIDDLVARYFGPAEQVAFRLVAPEARLSTFYRSWTLKEAYFKACGAGLGRALNEIDVAAADDSIRLPDLSGSGVDAYWTGRTLEPAPDFVAALGVQGRWAGSSLTKMMEWSPVPLT